VRTDEEADLHADCLVATECVTTGGVEDKILQFQ
jgi:hypothetical protein